MSRPMIVLYLKTVFSTMLRLLNPDCLCHSRRPSSRMERMFLFLPLIMAADLSRASRAGGMSIRTASPPLLCAAS